jgi:hypothetical protein
MLLGGLQALAQRWRYLLLRLFQISLLSLDLRMAGAVRGDWRREWLARGKV